MDMTTTDRSLIPGSSEYFEARRIAFSLIAELERRNEKSLFEIVIEARKSAIVCEILRAQRRTHLLEPYFDETESVERVCGYKTKRTYWCDEGVVRVDEENTFHEEGSRYSRMTYLNGLLHDVDGEKAVIFRDYHRISEEKNLDEDYVESWRHGILISHDSDERSLRLNLSDEEARYYGWDVDDAA